jgi:hypothetical protein
LKRKKFAGFLRSIRLHYKKHEETEMSKYEDLPVELLRVLLVYDSDTGKLFWRERPVSMFEDRGGRYTAHWCAKKFNAKHAGQEAFTSVSSKGYHTGGILGRVYSAHRVAWALYYGSWPTSDLDHINRVRTDNRICNLRASTGALNGHNKTMPNKHSSFVGVTWFAPTGTWVAKVSKDRKTYHVGTFSDPVEAARARDRKARELYGDAAFQNFSC